MCHGLCRRLAEAWTSEGTLGGERSRHTGVSRSYLKLAQKTPLGVMSSPSLKGAGRTAGQGSSDATTTSPLIPPTRGSSQVSNCGRLTILLWPIVTWMCEGCQGQIQKLWHVYCTVKQPNSKLEFENCTTCWSLLGVCCGTGVRAATSAEMRLQMTCIL